VDEDSSQLGEIPRNHVQLPVQESRARTTTPIQFEEEEEEERSNKRRGAYIKDLDYNPFEHLTQKVLLNNYLEWERNPSKFFIQR